MFARNEKNGICYYTSTLFEKYGIVHGFFTRHGGVSSGDFDSLNVSTARKDKNGDCDNPKNVSENYRLALSCLGTTPEKAVAAKQVHKNTVLRIKSGDSGRGTTLLYPEMPDCDGIFLDDTVSEIDALCVKTADCVPILLSSKDGKEISAVHAGWRGTVADIAVKSAEKFSCPKDEILCAIGPCIGVCCYEVGEEVYEAVRRLFEYKGMENLVDGMFRNSCICSACSKKYANLAQINRQLLISYGIPEKNIDLSEICTCCNENDFFSHRKSGGFSGTFPSVIKRNL